MDTKRCGGCREVKSVSEFHKNSRHKDGLQNYCKDCNRNAVKKHIHTYEGHNYAVRKARYQSLREQATEYKRERGCHFCSENEPSCLEFHHLDTTQKVADPSSIVNKSWKSFMEEVAKCVLLCANCHRKVHKGILQLPGSSSAG